MWCYRRLQVLNVRTCESNCHGGTLSKKVVFFATLTAYCRQVLQQQKTLKLYISELVFGLGTQKYKV